MTLPNLLEHARDHCTDPDCEIHNPEMVEDDKHRNAAQAWFLAGVAAMGSEMVGVHGENMRYIDRCYATLFEKHNLSTGRYGDDSAQS